MLTLSEIEVTGAIVKMKVESRDQPAHLTVLPRWFVQIGISAKKD